LFRDLERQVSVTATTGWGPDRQEIEEIVKASLDSVCRVDPLARRELKKWLDYQMRIRGGSVEDAWRANGKDLSRVEDFLALTRIHKLYLRAEELTGDCPFWLEPEHPFRGRQVSASKWLVTFGGGGKAIVVQTKERNDLSFGGAARLLVGRTTQDGHAVSVGLEFGASAAFPKNATGERSALVLGIDLVTPIVFRYTLTNTYLEAAGGYLARVNESDWGAIDHGVHVGVAFGGRALRQRFVFPGAAFGISYERTFGDDVTLIKVGGRVNFDLDR